MLRGIILKIKFLAVLVFERLRVDEPEKRLVNNQIYADVYIKINDEVLIGKLLIHSACDL